MQYNGELLELLSDDGNGSRLWISPSTGLVANESYDPDDPNSEGELNDDLEGWNCSSESALVNCQKGAR